MHRAHSAGTQIPQVPASGRVATSAGAFGKRASLECPDLNPLAAVAVVVPMLNAAKTWQAFNDGLRRQGLSPQQVLVIHSSSSDGTPELARAEGYRVVSMPRCESNHGGTRQAAARLLKSADVLVYLTQDAVLANDDAIVQLLRPFEDPSVGATFGRQHLA